MILTLDTSIAGAALPAAWPVIVDGIAGDRVLARLVGENAAAANQQRPVLTLEAIGDEQLLNKTIFAPVGTPTLVPLTVPNGRPVWMVDADGATPFILPADGPVYLVAVSAGRWVYDVQVLRGPDRDRVARLQALELATLQDTNAHAASMALDVGGHMRAPLSGSRKYPLTVVSPMGVTILSSWFPLGTRRARCLSSGVPIIIRRTFGATVIDDVVTSGATFEIANCGAFEVRGAPPISLVFEVETT